MATPPSPSSAADPAATSTRARLLAAAYDLLVQDGYQATTVQGVARRAGLTTGAIYANFANKQELMALAVLDRWANLQGQLLTLPAGAAEPATSGEWSDDLLVSHLAEHLAAPAAPEHRLLTEVTGAVLRDSSASPLVVAVQMLSSVVRSSIEEAKAAGAMNAKLSTDALVAVIVNLYLGTITSKAYDLDQPKLDEVLDVLAAVNKGLAAGTDR